MPARTDWGLNVALKKQAAARARREAQLAKDNAEQAAQDRLYAEAQAVEQAKRDATAALAAELDEANAAVSVAERQIEAARVAKVKADAESPAVIEALWARAEQDYAALMATKQDPKENLKVRASLAMTAATSLAVPPELWLVSDMNIVTLPDFCGMDWRIQRISPETTSGFSTRDVFVVRVQAGASLVTVTHPGILADLIRQHPSLRPAEKVSN